MSKTRRNVRFAATAIACITALAVAGCSKDEPVTESTATGSPIKIGVVASMSNKTLPTTAGPEGLKAWAATVNGKGGLQGHPVEIVVRDDGNDPAKSLTAVKQLVESDHVIALSNWTSNEASWAGYVEDKGIPVVGGTNYAPVWQTNPTFFPVQSTLQAALYSQAVMAKNAGAHSLGNFYAADVSSAVEAVDAKAAVAKAVGLDGSFHGAISPSQPDYTAACLSAKRADVEAISFAGVPAERVAPACSQQGFDPLWILPSEAVTEEVVKVPALQNLLAPQYAFPFFLDNPATAEYRAAMEKDYRGPEEGMFSPLTASAWMAGLVYENVVNNIGDLETVGAQNMFDGLYKVKDLSADGLLLNLSYSPDDTERIVDCFWETRLDDGEWDSINGMEKTCVS